MKSFNHKLYVNLLKESSELAYNYRVDCGLEKPKLKVKEVKEEVKEVKEVKEEVKEVKEVKEEMTREELKQLLIKENIYFAKNITTNKLLELCIENNLI